MWWVEPDSSGLNPSSATYHLCVMGAHDSPSLFLIREKEGNDSIVSTRLLQRVNEPTRVNVQDCAYHTVSLLGVIVTILMSSPGVWEMSSGYPRGTGRKELTPSL